VSPLFRQCIAVAVSILLPASNRVSANEASNFKAVFVGWATERPAGLDDLDNVVFEGTVRDAAGALIAGASVRLVFDATAVERLSDTNTEGRYRILAFEPGRYTLKVNAAGFGEEEITGIQVTAGRKVTNDFTLAPAGANEQVVIESGGSVALDVTRTVNGGTIEQREIEELPLLNRDPLQLVFLLGGVAEPPLSVEGLAEEGRGTFFRGTPEEAGSFSLTGAPATSNNITIDGLDNNDDRTARERISLNPESVAEVQVITNQYAAEYGRASGGRINIRTRGGSNDYHGDGYFYFGDESLNANTFFRNARGLGRIPLQQRRVGGVLSGPLRKQRDFVFAGYERLDIPDFIEINALVPVGTNSLFPLPAPNRPVSPGSTAGRFFEEISTPETRNLVNVRADFSFSQSHNSSARFDLVRGDNRRGFPGGARLVETLLLQGRDSDSVSVSDNLIVSDAIVNQTRFQFSRLIPRSSAAAVSAGVVIRDPLLTAGSFTGSDSSPAFAREEKRWQIQDNVTLVHGSHVIKAGGDLQFVRSTFTDLFATGGIFTFDTIDDFLRNSPSRFQQRFDTTSEAANDVAGLFAQDEWRIRPNLTVSYGIRWDNESILEDRDNFSPRVAVAWDPMSTGLFGRFAKQEPGKTVVRAGFGLFYNRALLRTIDDFSLGRTTLLIDSNLNARVLGVVKFPRPIADRALADPFAVSETEFLRRISPALEIPYTVQSGLGVERQLTRRLIVTADYIYTRGAHLWRESNINAPVTPEGFANLSEYLLSRDFDNRPVAGGDRPISGANADVVRFDLGANISTTPGAIDIVNGVRLLTLGLNAPRSSNITAALNAVRSLRPNPALTQVELLESTGNSFYHGGIIAVRYSAGRAHLRASYTLSKFIDEGTTNTASPQDLRDRRAERSLSLQDQRHRFVLNGSWQVPAVRLDLSSVISFGSSKPFNIGSGFDRNLNDISNDRPNFIVPMSRPEWRRPNSPPGDVKANLVLAPIGSSGNLPRNYGRGPGTRTFDMRVSRAFVTLERVKIRPSVEVFNVLNATTFSFGSEFVDRDDANFLVPARTQRPRSIVLSLKISL
jgi:hypothetical protein